MNEPRCYHCQTLLADINAPCPNCLPNFGAVGPSIARAFERSPRRVAPQSSKEQVERDFMQWVRDNHFCFSQTTDGNINLSKARVMELFVAARRAVETGGEHHGLDNARQVFFYEQDFYVLSNFSSFRVRLLVDDGFGGEIHCTFDTSEAAYHWFKFPHVPELQARIRAAQSAHDAFKLAERYRDQRRPDWDAVKVDIMREILRAKAQQHEYVRRKLLATGDRELIENSWRDDFWGWGPNRDGRNQLGRLWMEIRAELRSPEKSNCNSVPPDAVPAPPEPASAPGSTSGGADL